MTTYNAGGTRVRSRLAGVGGSVRGVRADTSFMGAAKAGIASGAARGFTQVAGRAVKGALSDRAKKLKAELEAGKHHRHNLHNKFTPSADHAKRALLNIGKTYTDAGYLRRGVSNAHHIKEARAGKRSQLKYRATGLPQGIQKRFRAALAAKAANKGRKIKGKASSKSKGKSYKKKA